MSEEENIFMNEILRELEGFFAAEELITETENDSMVVRVIHPESSSYSVSQGYNSQAKNKAICLVQLLKQLKENKVAVTGLHSLK